MDGRPSQPGLRAGRRLGEFVLGEKLGRGGFADVYRASQPSLGRAAVVKVLRGATDPRDVRQFEREARMACQLDHPFAAHVYAFGVEPDGVMWIAMELVRGISLAEWLETKGPIPLNRFVSLFERLCDVVHTAHLAGLIHRDIKPSNVMVVTRVGKLMPKLLDFGIAMAHGNAHEAARPAIAQALPGDSGEIEDTLDPTRTDRYQVSGTPAYMAPEQWRAGGHDHRVDIYALGIVAYRCLTGRPPFTGTNSKELQAQHLRQPPPRLGDPFSPALDEVIWRALAKDPADRYAAALDLGAAFQRAAGISEDPWLSRDEQRAYITAPPHLAASVAAVADARNLAEACEATQRLVAALAQWLGVIAIAATAGLGAYVEGQEAHLGKFRREAMSPRDWLDLALSLCAPYAERDEDFPIPEMVRWLVDDTEEGRGPDTLLALLTVVRGETKTFPREVLARVLRGLRFVHGYTLLAGDREWTGATRDQIRPGDPLAISDGDRTPLVQLAPLVVAAAPSPGDPVELFAPVGGGRFGARQVAYPKGYERESDDLWPWLDERFAVRAADSSSTFIDRVPYRGLAPFTSADAELFYGRERLVDQLFNRILVHPFVALTGPSGSGKSSVVSAGVIPRLPAEWISVTMRPGRHPVAALEAALAKSGLPGAGEAASIAPHLAAIGRRLLLVVDQAEELLALAVAEQRNYFASLLAYLIAGDAERVRVIVTIRHDFIGRADELPQWRELIQHNLLLVTVPSQDELAQMVVAPARHVGYELDDPLLVRDMVAEVADRPGALPLLSFAASRLWEARDLHTKTLTRAAYVAMGGVAGALARYAEDTYAHLSPRQQTLARELLRRLITADGTSAPTRRDELVSMSDGIATVLEHLIAARLLVASERADGGEDVAIVHEALIDRWPRLVQWRADDAAGARHRDELRSAAALWDTRGRDPSYLWRGEALATYRAWAPRWAGSLTTTEVAFGTASLRADARTRRVRRGIVVLALAALSAALVVMLTLYRRAGDNRDDAEERYTDLLADRGRSELLADHPLRALVYLSAAYSRGRDGAGMRVSLAQAMRPLDRGLARVTAHPAMAGVERHGELLFSGAFNQPLRSWRYNNNTLEPVATFTHDGGYEGDHWAMSPSGQYVFLHSRGGMFRVWNNGKLVTAKQTTDTTDVNRIAASNELAATDSALETPTGIFTTIALSDREGNRRQLTPPLFGQDKDPKKSRGVPVMVQFSEDGELIAAATPAGVISVWRTADGSLLWTKDLKQTIKLAVITRERILATTLGGEVIVLALDRRGAQIARFPAHATVFGVAVAEDQHLFATSGADLVVKLWSLIDGKPVGNLTHVSAVFGVRFNEDGTRMLTSSGDSTATLWDVPRRLRIGRIDAGADVWSIEFTKHEQVVTTDSVGGLYIWDGRPDNIATSFSGHGAEVWSIAFAPEPGMVATFGADNSIRRWRLADAKETGRVTTNMENTFLQRITYLPDGRLVGPRDFHAGVWNQEGDRIGQLQTLYLQAATSDPHGRVAVANGYPIDGKYQVVLWDVDTERPLKYLLRAHQAQGLTFDSSGSKLAISDPGGVAVWDVDHDSVLWEAPGPAASQIAFSPDGRVVGSTSTDGHVWIRDAMTGVVVQTLKQEGRAICVAFSRDGALLATAISNNRIYLWDLASGKPAAVLLGHENVINDLAFTPDGKQLVSVSRDGRALVWDVRYEQRSPDEIARIVTERAPFHLVGSDLINNEPATPPPVTSRPP